MVLLTDTTSSVKGFEEMGEEFVREMTVRGMRTCTTEEFGGAF